MWFDIIKDNKRTKYYREFLEAATQLGGLIDSPDNIKAYENFTGDKRPESMGRGTAVLYTNTLTTKVGQRYKYKFAARANIEQEMTFHRTYGLNHPDEPRERLVHIGLGNNPHYNQFVNKMFKTEYPELHNKIWEFALFFNKIVNPNLLGKEADEQRELFERSSTNIFKENLRFTYKFISRFLGLIREGQQIQYTPASSFSLLPENLKEDIRLIKDPTHVLRPRKDFINRLITYPRIRDARDTSTSFALKTGLNRTYLKTVTDYILDNWETIINTLRTDDAEVSALNTPNIKTLILRYKHPEGTEFYNRWLADYQKLHEEEIEKNIEEILNTPEEDLGNWEDNDDGVSSDPYNADDEEFVPWR